MGLPELVKSHFFFSLAGQWRSMSERHTFDRVGCADASLQSDSIDDLLKFVGLEKNSLASLRELRKSHLTTRRYSPVNSLAFPRSYQELKLTARFVQIHSLLTQI